MIKKNFSLSKKFLKLHEYGGEIRRVFMLGQKIQQENPKWDGIDLSLGNPDIESPVEIDEFLIQLLKKKEPLSHRYMDAAGLPDVRNFIAQQLTHSESVPLNLNTVYLTVGAAGGLQLIFKTCLQAKDEVIIFSPYFPEYIPYILSCDAKPIICPCDEQHLPNLNFFKKALTKKTKLILMNSPNNPTGVIYPQKLLEEMAEILNLHSQKTGKIPFILSDEPYSRVAFLNETVPSILKIYPYSWIVRSFSKDLSLAGERIGYIAWGSELEALLPQFIQTLRNTSRILGFVSAPRLMQRVLPFIFNLKIDVSIYEKRAQCFVQYLEKNKIHAVKPQAGFFVFPKSPIADDKKFCDALIQHGVLCVPGSGFGVPGYFRASLTQNLNLIQEAAIRIGNCDIK